MFTELKTGVNIRYQYVTVRSSETVVAITISPHANPIDIAWYCRTKL